MVSPDKDRLSVPGRARRRLPLRIMAALILAGALYFARLSGADYTTYRNDFNVYYYAAREVLSGRDPYQNRLSPWTPYLYPPVLAELLTPIALLPLPIAAYIWSVLSALSILVAARLASILSLHISATDAARQSAEANKTNWDPRTVIALVTMTVIFRFALDSLAMGQVNAIVASLAVAHLYLHETRRSGLSAIALALAASIKITPAILIIYHLSKGRIRFAIGTTVLLGGLLAASFLPFGRRAWSAVESFQQQTISNGQGFDLGYSGNQSIRGAESRLSLEPDEARRRPYNAVSLAVSAVLLMAALFAARTRKPEIAAAAPIFCCMVMLSPLAWKGHFVALVLPVAYLAARAIATSPGLSRRLARFTVAVVFALFTLTSPTLTGVRVAEWADCHSLVLAGALVTYLSVLL